ncbi:MAG: Fur family transcriptional regulator [Candidatus Thorarchaeota archaeon]
MIDSLRKNGLRLTPQRIEMLRVLENQGKHHPSFSEVYAAVRTNLPSVSQSTILKNMAIFEELRIVRSFSFRGETRYELNPAPHVNFVNTSGEIVDIEGEEIEEILEGLIDTIKRKTGIDATNLLVVMNEG